MDPVYSYRRDCYNSLERGLVPPTRRFHALLPRRINSRRPCNSIRVRKTTVSPLSDIWNTLKLQYPRWNFRNSKPAKFPAAFSGFRRWPRFASVLGAPAIMSSRLRFIVLANGLREFVAWFTFDRVLADNFISLCCAIVGALRKPRRTTYDCRCIWALMPRLMRLIIKVEVRFRRSLTSKVERDRWGKGIDVSFEFYLN